MTEIIPIKAFTFYVACEFQATERTKELLKAYEKDFKEKTNGLITVTAVSELVHIEDVK